MTEIPLSHESALHLNPAERVEYWSTFQSTVEVPFPAVATGNVVDDVAAVLSGSKPATILSPDSLDKPMVRELVAHEADRFADLSQTEAVDAYGGSKIFWGKQENVNTLAELYEGRGGNDSPLSADETFHRAVGAALGYPKEAVDAFIARTAKSHERASQKGRLGSAAGKLAIPR